MVLKGLCLWMGEQAQMEKCCKQEMGPQFKTQNHVKSVVWEYVLATPVLRRQGKGYPLEDC